MRLYVRFAAVLTALALAAFALALSGAAEGRPSPAPTSRIIAGMVSGGVTFGAPTAAE